jgi:hypothetical protein
MRQMPESRHLRWDPGLHIAERRRGSPGGHVESSGKPALRLPENQM